MKPTFAIASILILFQISVNAQDESEISAQQLGLSYSSVGGAGIHYIQPISPKDNVKFTGILIYRSESQDKETYFSLGFDYQWDLLEDDSKRVYFLAGAHLDNELSNTLYFDYTDDSNRKTFFGTGIGLGADFGNTQNGIIVNGHISYQLTKGFGDIDRTRIGLGGGIGLGFNY